MDSVETVSSKPYRCDEITTDYRMLNAITVYLQFPIPVVY